MNELERRGALEVLRASLELVGRRYGERIANGRNCDECGAHGFGTPEDHRKNCRGRRTVVDLRRLIDRLEEEWR